MTSNPEKRLVVLVVTEGDDQELVEALVDLYNHLTELFVFASVDSALEFQNNFSLHQELLMAEIFTTPLEGRWYELLQRANEAGVKNQTLLTDSPQQAEIAEALGYKATSRDNIVNFYLFLQSIYGTEDDDPIQTDDESDQENDPNLH